MSRITKNQAKQEVTLYGDLLMDYGIISDISAEEVRNQMKYSFMLFDSTYSYVVECMGVLELALVLSCMWSAYSKARQDL